MRFFRKPPPTRTATVRIEAHLDGATRSQLEEFTHLLNMLGNDARQLGRDILLDPDGKARDPVTSLPVLPPYRLQVDVSLSHSTSVAGTPCDPGDRDR